MRLISDEEVLKNAKESTFTFAEDRRRYMDFLEYCLNNAPTVETQEAYNEGFYQVILKGKRDAAAMKEDADGCKGCAFEDVESWEPPCEICKRNSKDYWRAKKV